MIVVPLVFSSIIIGVASIAAENGFARMGAKTLVYYIITSSLSILVGLFLVNTFQPGVMEDGLAKLGRYLADHSDVVGKLEAHDTSSLFSVFLNLIPSNIIMAAAEGQLLGISFSPQYSAFS